MVLDFTGLSVFQADSGLPGINKYRIDGSQLFLNSGLRPAFWHGFAPAALILTFQFIHFVLCQLQYRPQSFVINDFFFFFTVQFVECLTVQ